MSDGTLNLAENMRQMAIDKLVTPEMMQKVGEMQQLLQQALNEDMKRALDRIAEALQKVDPQALQRAFTEAQFRQEDLLRRLDQTIELLKKAQLEQRLARAARLLAELVEQEESIRDAARDVARTPPSEPSYMRSMVLCRDATSFSKSGRKWFISISRRE